jgi:hypothetical protein
MRSPALFFGSFLVLVIACGGRSDDILLGGSGVGGSSSGSGGSGGGSGSGGSSSGGGSGGSSGAGSSSSSGSSGSSGAGGCTPLPGCKSSEQCPEPGGCGYCYCVNDNWACESTGDCDGGPSMDAASPGCPPYPPPPGTQCPSDGVGCGWASPGGCGDESCYCQNGYWQCISSVCDGGGPPSCPPGPPTDQSPCNDVGAYCDYPLNGVCADYICQCDPSGTWGCGEYNCVDSGLSDTGPPDTGVFDAGGPGCGQVGTSCVIDSQCCSGLCNGTSLTCE